MSELRCERAGGTRGRAYSHWLSNRVKIKCFVLGESGLIGSFTDVSWVPVMDPEDMKSAGQLASIGRGFASWR